MDTGADETGSTTNGGDPAVRVVWGSAPGPTALSSYDAALAAAGVENYNLVRVSSIVPAGATVEPVDTAPDLGPPGNRLTVVEARVTVGGDGTGGDVPSGPGAAGLAWAIGPGPGLFHEVAGPFDEVECSRRLAAGLDAGRAFREWSFDESGERVVSVDPPAGEFGTAVVLGVYGRGEPVL